MKSFAITMLAVSMLAAPLSASEEWLPAAVAEGLAQQLGERMTQAGLTGSGEGRVIDSAREAVAGMRQHLDAWELGGVLENAPRFPELELPASTNQYVDAMTRYSLCNLVLFRVFADPAFREDRRAMSISTYGLTGMTMAIVRLRDPYLQEGGTDATMEAALTRPELGSLMEEIQKDEDLLLHVERQCRPVVLTLLGPAE